MKKIALFLILGFIMTLAGAQTTPEEYIKDFFAKVEQGNFDGAMDALPLSDMMKNDTSGSKNTLKKLKTNAEKMGKYCGYEQINVEETSPSLVTYAYFIKYKNAPERVVFVFYKPDDSWQVNRVNIAGGGASQRGVRNNQQQSRFRR